MNAILPQHPSHELFNAPRIREADADLFARLLADTSAYGVTQELVDRSLSQVSTQDLSDALQALLANPEALELVAKRSYYHPNGFLKLQLCVQNHMKVRLHYWPASMLPAEENVHNHRWRLASKVMLGQLDSELYREALPTERGAEARELRLYRKGLGQHGAEGIRCGQRFVKRTQRVCRSAGEAYTLDTDVLHRIVHRGEGATMTLMVQSAPQFIENHMLSTPDVAEPELKPRRLESVDQLRAQLIEIIGLLDAEK